MIALDTNILVRLITEDDPEQADAAQALLRKADDAFFIPDLVLAELAWVLLRRYSYTRPEVGKVLSAILDRRDVVFEDESRIREAVRAFNEGLDFADALIIGIARAAGCGRLASFDETLDSKYPEFILRLRP